ncbi:MAG: hypothetical protein ABJF04_05065 [Reichenbachiella sp.]|uniref:hypothetical protein n=1 Tax=Reichenbachiella sp. TaxID=2184521 RepID=UPI0032630DFD
MKLFFTCVALVFFSHVGHCLTNPNQQSKSTTTYAHYNANLRMMNLHYAKYQHELTNRELEIQLSRKEKYNKAGNTLLAVGAVATVVGVIMMATADDIFYTTTTSTYGGTESDGDPQGAVGLLLTTTGVAGIVTGAIFKSKAKRSR